MKYAWTMVVPAVLAVVNTAAAGAPEVPVEAFISLCMSAKGNPDVVANAALQRGFKVASPEQKARLMRAGGQGDAYVARDIALVVEKGRRMCTVFAKSDNPEATGKQLKDWLPPPSTGFTVQTEAVGDTTTQSTVMYRIGLAGKPFAAWVFSINKRPSLFNIAITLQ
ncbi:NMCC_0638 family (lipo)protein [Pseudoduganella umbonata]|uniref:Xanthine dehydrogenase molybdopterin-binding subunit B n=1 Tax=Pseudoduganella umbonata TaxID=864828 RepID=A0A4P8HN99_9BURK|nr:hypothetical protein [Pseudoduganella umbonata]MBB3224878.1 xanthine dehydrogenase molybdopterin-binding subunit B [Pseudoduganella umbonata]QCP11179.1 hypothetical protein FCL38_12720 [Pseudoduganella umbonata]